MDERAIFKIISFYPISAEVLKYLFSPHTKAMKLEAKLEINVINDISNKEAVYRKLEETDIVINDFTSTIQIDGEMAKHVKKVKSIQQFTTRFIHIDIKACKKAGIRVTNIVAATNEARQRIIQTSIDNVIKVLKVESIQSVVSM